MAIAEIIAPPPEKKGGFGGLLGKVLGTVAGGIAGAFTGTPQGVMGGASLGGSLGGAVGGIADPAKVDQVTTVPSKMERSAMARPEIQIAKMEEVKPLIAREQRFSADEAQRLIEDITAAQETLRGRLR